MNISVAKQHVNREYSLHMPKSFPRPKNLLQRVYEQHVALEDMFTRGITIYGSIRVNNISFHKRVFVRFTIDQWKTCSTINAHHSMYHADSNTDSFQFKLTVSKEKLQTSSILITHISFAICYCITAHEFWDNNFGQNYKLDIIEGNPLDKITDPLKQLSSTKSIIYDDWFYRQIAYDYHAVLSTLKQTRNLCGLKNLGGTCYMNSVLQSLSLTNLLTESLLNDNHLDSNSRFFAEESVLNEYLNLLYLLSCGEYCVLTPNPFKQIFGHLNKTYLKNQQQDAHEFLLLLLDYLHKDLIRIKSNNEVQNNNQIENNSTILDLFYGMYKTTTTCLQCKQPSIILEPFICLSLPIPTTDQCTLQDCLTYFNNCEYLTDDSKWFCSTCQCLCDAERRLEIEKLPKILIIQLKRFEIDGEQHWIKNNTLVLYPEDNFDLKQYCCSSSTDQTLYTLYSVINHAGSLNDGHYTTFCRDLSKNPTKWFECDDDKIEFLYSDKLHTNSNAYLLFYITK